MQSLSVFITDKILMKPSYLMMTNNKLFHLIGLKTFYYLNLKHNLPKLTFNVNKKQDCLA